MRYTYFVLIFLLTFVPAFAQSPPEANSGSVNDFAGLISQQAKREIVGHIAKLKSDRNVEMVVVTINNTDEYVEGMGVPELAHWFRTGWNVGTGPDDDGILMLVSKEDREAFIALGSSYPKSFDGRMDDVFDQHMKLYFRVNNFDLGMRSGVEAVILQTDPDYVPDEGPSVIWFFVAAGLMLAFIFQQPALQALRPQMVRFQPCPYCTRKSLRAKRRVSRKEALLPSDKRETVTVNCSWCGYSKKTVRDIPTIWMSPEEAAQHGAPHRGGFRSGGSRGGGSRGGGGRW